MSPSLVLYSNPGNPLALKILAVSKFAKLKTQLQIVTESVGKQRLPVLKVDQKVEIFVSNSAVIYYAEQGKLSTVQSLNSILNFEGHKIWPALVNYFEGGNQTAATKLLKEILTELENTLGTCSFFSGNPKPNILDAILWPSMYVLFESKDPLTSEFPKLQSWCQNVTKDQLFAACIREVKPLSGKDAITCITECRHTVDSCIENAVTIKLENLSVKSQVAKEASNTKSCGSGDSSPPLNSSYNATIEEIEIAKRHWNESVTLPGEKVVPKEILPVAGQKNYFITSALPYVNNVPHLGNIIGCVLSADVFARYSRVRDRNVLYICGTDEYGTATETKALEEKLTPKQICDKYNKLHSEIYQWFNISFDYFGRTTTQEQTEVGQDIFMRLYENGYLKEMVVQQLFCQPCQRFLSDRFVEGTCPSCGYEDARGDQCDKCGRLTNSIELKNPRCKVCSSLDVITKNSDQVFLDLPELEAKAGLEEWLDKACEGWTSNAKHIAKSWMKEGLRERCITRDLKWGTPVPLEKYKNKVFYVWFDAPIGYISMTKCYTKNWQSWWVNPDPHIDIDYYQFMAKDNVPFHAILFPASLKGTNQPWTIVKHIMATEYLNYEDGKFSKSRGIGVFGNDAIETGIPSDIWRFYLVYVRPESQDSAFSWDDFMTKNNSELLNNLGNFINRSLTFLTKYFENKVPEIDLLAEDYVVIAEINKEIGEYVNLMEACRLRDALRQILAVSKIGNVYFQSQKPWTLTKNEESLKRCSTVCGLGAQIVFLIMTLLDPFMPAVGKQIREQLNVKSTFFSHQLRRYIPSGHEIGKVYPLFSKLEPGMIDAMKNKYGGQQKTEVTVEPQKQPQKPQQGKKSGKKK